MKHLNIFLILFLLPLFIKAQDISFPNPDRIKYDKYGLQIEGKDTFVYSGAFHYFRVPQELWADRFQKMKEAGFNGVETYIPWNWHEREMPSSPKDFSKMNLTEFSDWLKMAEDFGFYIIVRPGPYICAEWDGGGFPQWLMKKSPAKYERSAWLQSDDPEFFKWNEHWYEAVCKVVAPHQITRKPKGEPGVILFQIENEYERVNWFPKDMKRKYLEDLAVFTRSKGIDVPIFTCWTTESRNVKEGPLVGVFDFVNVYPRWTISRSFGSIVDRQLSSQPDSPLMNGELQGGWYSEVGGKLSINQDGVAPVQMQNITLYALQRGFSLINYYMLVGGTNFDDWASRETTSTYDYAAAIQENGGVNDKYRRVKGLGAMLQEHGARIARSETVNLDVVASDKEVEVVLRRSSNGDNFFFVRTEARNRSFFGTIIAKEKDGTSYTFDYALEPFGSKVFYLPSNSQSVIQGKWYPELPASMNRPSIKSDTLKFDKIEYKADDIPLKWSKLKKNQTLEDYKIYDRHYVYYKIKVAGGKVFTVGRIGDKLINNSKADVVLAMVNGNLLAPESEDKETVSFKMPEGSDEAILLFENRGLHHHTRRIVEDYWFNGIRSVTVDGKYIPLEFASVEKERGLSYSSFDTTDDSWIKVDVNATKSNALLTWHKITFELPEKENGVWVPWSLKLKAKGSGFVYLNGKCIGRYWNEGPQFDFFMPECWLNFGKGKSNVITFSLRPIDGEARVESVTIVPDKFSAEYR